MEDPRSRVPRKGLRSWVPPMGLESRVPGEGSQEEGPGFHFSGMPIIIQPFYDKNIVKLFERKNNRKNLAKHVIPHSYFVIAKFTILKGLKG